MNKNVNKKLKQIWRCRALYLMILPAIIALFIFHYIPVYGILLAFKDYNSKLGILRSPWVGLKHFKRFIEYPYFGRLMWNTVRISLVSLLDFPFPIIFAIMINEMRQPKLKKVCQTITYAPYFISTVLVCSITILFLSTEGLFNKIGALFGAEAVNYMSKPNYFPWIYMISGVWSGLGWGTVIYVATLAGTSMELVEAATIDGANRMQTIWHVHLPHLKPTIITLFILRMGGILGVGFEKVFLLQNDLNKIGSSVIATYVYEIGLLKSEFSYSTAIGLFNSLINIVFIVLANAISRKVSDIALW